MYENLLSTNSQSSLRTLQLKKLDLSIVFNLNLIKVDPSTALAFLLHSTMAKVLRGVMC